MVLGNQYGDASTPYSKKVDSAYTQLDPGPYIGVVKDNVDPTKMGTLSVLIPSLANTNEGTLGQLYKVKYLPHFYGMKSPSAVESSNVADFESSQHSYGMWMVPPDIDTRVMVIFVEGKVNQGYWFGCVPDPFINHMIPGIASSTDTFTSVGNGGVVGDTDVDSKEKDFGTNSVPAGEVNRGLFDVASANGIDRLKKPIHPFAVTLRQEGLIQDTVRGTTTSSARRESPSQVFGISTPGRVNSLGKKSKLGPKDAQTNESRSRGPGHTFTLDDGDNKGDSQLIRLRSASGHQLLLNDSNGVVYLANGTGNVWMEFSANGAIDIYAGNSLSVRSRGDMNFHSDGNINLFAKNQLRMKSKNKMVLDAGAIQQYADQDIQFQATKGSVTTKSPAGSIISHAGMTQLHMASGQIHLAGGQVHFNTIGPRPDLIPTIERTSILDPSGTQTKEESYPDVNPSSKYLSKPLEVTQNGMLSMTGMRIPTHEPYPFHYDKIVSFAGSSPSMNDAIPGTPEFIAMRNRNSDNPTIRMGQFQADLQTHLEKAGVGQVATAVNKTVSSINNAVSTTKKIQDVADQFTKDYSKIYGLPKDVLSISSITSGVNEVVNQTVKSVTGSTVNLLKDQVFINQSGILYTAGNLGQAVTGTVSNVLGDLSAAKGVFTTAGGILNDVTGSISSVQGVIGGGFGGGLINNINQGANVINAASTITNSYKNIIGGNVTAVTSITTLVSNIGTKIASVAKSIGSIFKW